ncbi:MAG: hypothetical protein UT34_C0001G0019 [candidate division WS6 bacterium GW2011_GWF2_39_15]|uniref:EamA domain-containing protein n=1 Tax=candidate division WS6 bacterium GW2011_GWF2_39_15 TaxID=1619100 RepID=A0A0G0MPJ7_9BACT|nr:MAG: hypothetical protein UT34_C0001G0019 [candidate division WS6 bacterium GW2011_GWF2_39_15]
MNYPWYLKILTVLIVTVFVVIGDVLLKNSISAVGTKKVLYILGGIIIYIISAFGFQRMYKVMEFSNSGVIYAVISVVLFTAIGLFLYHEKVTPYEVLGIVLALISVYLMSRFAN